MTAKDDILKTLNWCKNAISVKIGASGNRGALAGYETSSAISNGTINADSPDSQYSTGNTLTVADGAAGTSWIKQVQVSTSVTVNLGSNWSWIGGSAPEMKYPALLVFAWNNSHGIVNCINGAA